MNRDYLLPPRKLRLLQNRTLQAIYVLLLVGTAGYVVATGGDVLDGFLVGLVAATIGVVAVAIGYVFYLGVHQLPDPE